MTRENFERVLRVFQTRRPWKAFTLELVNGCRLEVSHPEALTQYGELVKLRSASGLNTVFEYRSVIRFLDATGTA